MGNTDGKLEATDSAGQKNIVHFEHTFPAKLISFTVNGQVALPGEDGRPGSLTLKQGRAVFSMLKSNALSEENICQILYPQISELVWDHAEGGVRVSFTLKKVSPTDPSTGSSNPAVLVLNLGARSIQCEENIQLRWKVESSDKGSFKCQYMGICAGATKPKPFQRKRPNLSTIPQGRLPTLIVMRNASLAARFGLERPQFSGQSRRTALLQEAIYTGYLTFPLLSLQQDGVRSSPIPTEIRLGYSSIDFCGKDIMDYDRLSYSYHLIQDWSMPEVEAHALDAVLQLDLKAGPKVQIRVRIEDAWYIRQTLEYFFNRDLYEQGDQPKPGTSHGRCVCSKHTLLGEAEVHDQARVGTQHVTDDKGKQVYTAREDASHKRMPSGKVLGTMEAFGSDPIKKRSSIMSSLAKKASFSSSFSAATSIKSSSAEQSGPVLPRNIRWSYQVVHNGWLWKRGGTGPKKSWLRRYFVLYTAPAGHFLAYYLDQSHSPLFSDKRAERQVIDLSKVAFIHPNNTKAGRAHAFDLVSVDREWFFAADSEESVQRWVLVLTQSIDKDVAIVPDDELIFQVKMKMESTTQPLVNRSQETLNSLQTPPFQVYLKVSASGVEISHRPDGADKNSKVTLHRALSNGKISNCSDQQLWCFTDFFKWSVVWTKGKSHHPKGLMVHVFTDTNFGSKNIYFLKTKQATNLATAIEFHIEKFMARMHLSKEAEAGKSDRLSGHRSVSSSVEVKEDKTWEIASDVDNVEVEASDNDSDEEEIEEKTTKGESDREDDEAESVLDLLDFSTDQTNTPPPVPGNVSSRDLGDFTSGFQYIPDLKQPIPPAVVAQDLFFPVTAPSTQWDLGPNDFSSFLATEPAQDSGSLHQSFSSDCFNVPDQQGSSKNVTTNDGGYFESPNPFDEFDDPKELSGIGNGFQQLAVQDPSDELLRFWYKALLPSPAEGCLFENEVLSLWWRHEHIRCQGNVTITCRNKSMTTPLQNLLLAFVNMGQQLRLNIIGVDEGSNAFGSTQLDPGGTIQCLCTIQVLAPILTQPQLSVQYVYGGNVSSKYLELPIVLTQFIEPLSLQRGSFSQNWMSLGQAPERTSEEIMEFNVPINPAQVLQIIISVFKLAQVTDAGVPIETMIASSGTLHTAATNPQGEFVSIGCLARVEFQSQNKLKLQIRTVHQSVTVALLGSMKSILIQYVG